MSGKEKDELIILLGDALLEASAHLDYCGWGDSWERECSKNIRLQVHHSVDVYEKEKKNAKRRVARNNKNINKHITIIT